MDVPIRSEQRARPNLIVVAVAAAAIGAGATAGAYQAVGLSQSIRPATPSAPAPANLDLRDPAGEGDNCFPTLQPHPC